MFQLGARDTWLLAERTLRALSSSLLCGCARHPNVARRIIETQHPAGAAAHAAKHESKANGPSINDLSLIHLIASEPPLPSVLPDKRQRGQLYGVSQPLAKLSTGADWGME
jgi:hypothetical protein